MDSLPAPSTAETLKAYEALADAYDLLAADYQHGRWLTAIERLARDYGVAGHRMLDVACGTGRSFIPMLDRGWEVTAYDLSPGMVARARAAAAGRAHVFCADMTRPGALGEFDLITCLDDAVNYLLEPDAVSACLRGFSRNLASGGVAVWDVNTLVTHRGAFGQDWIRRADDTLIAWQGQTPRDLSEGGIAQAKVDVFARHGSTWQLSSGVHRQRHYAADEMSRMAANAGLRVLDILGQSPGARLTPLADEQSHPKLLFVACRAHD